MKRRFVFKIVALMVLVSVAPLLTAVVLFDRALSEVVVLGLDEQVGSSLDFASSLYQANVQLRKQNIALQNQRLADNPELHALLNAPQVDKAAVERLLAGEAEAMSLKDQAVSAIVIFDPTAKAGEGSAPAALAELDRRHSFPPSAWQQKDFTATIDGAEGRRLRVTVTYALEARMFERHGELGQTTRTFAHLSRMQEEVTSEYTFWFFLVAAGVVIAILIFSVVWALAATRPLHELAAAAERVGRGELDVQVEVRGGDEFAQLTTAFNTMVVELGQARERLSYLERVSAWQEIARRLAHEIKNPLTPILLAMQQLDRKYDDYLERPLRYRKLVTTALEIVTEEVESLRTLVKEFSDFARLPKIEPRSTPVVGWVTDLLRNNPQYEAALKPLHTTCEEDVQAPIDATMMRRVLINLIDNAIDAMRPVERAVEDSVQVSIDADAARKTVTIAVTDNGEGVKGADLERIFDPYFTTKADGTGLGLAIVRKIVIDHGGDIRVESPVDSGAGTRMTVVLPLVEG